MAESIVQKKVAKLILQELGDILSHEKPVPGMSLVTISVVRVTGDLSIAKVYVSVLPDRMLEEVEIWLNDEVWEYRKLLAARIRNKVRKIPEIRFFADDSFKEAEEMDKLLDELRKEDES